MGDVQLSPNERQVLRLLAQGLTQEQIAEQMQVSLFTLGQHLENIGIKLASTHQEMMETEQ